MDCIFLRHGIAIPCEEWNGYECDRPLSDEGCQKTKKAVAGLKTLGILPTHVLTSPFRRAQETAKIVAHIFALKPETLQVCEELQWDQSPIGLFALLKKLPEQSQVICIGHEPHLSQAAACLVFGNTVPGVSLKKAGACCVWVDGDPSIGHAILKWWLTAAQLRRLR